MRKEVSYNTQEEKLQIISENADLHLIEDRNWLTGNFLVFSDEPNHVDPIYINASNGI